MKERYCPFCNDKLFVKSFIAFTDYYCHEHRDHYFSERLSFVKDAESNLIKDDDGDFVRSVIKIKLCLLDKSGEKYYLKVNFDNGNFQVWKKNSLVVRNTVQSVFQPDYSNREALLNKIKTYLIFS